MRSEEWSFELTEPGLDDVPKLSKENEKFSREEPDYLITGQEETRCQFHQYFTPFSHESDLAAFLLLPTVRLFCQRISAKKLLIKF